MDDLRVGHLIRAARIRRGWRQRDLARAVGVSDATISRVERGKLDAISLGTIRAIARVLEIGVELVARSRGAEPDRVVNARHGALGEAVIRWLGTRDGWVARPEVSFSRFGERGVIDVLAWHAATRALLVIELKTAIVDVGELLGTFDRKLRNGWEVARTLGWEPETVSGLLVVAEGPTNRRRVDAHAATFTAALPARVRAIRSWLRRPVGDLRGLIFFSDRHQGQVIQRFHQPQRVRRSSGACPRPIPRLRERGASRAVARPRPGTAPEA